MTAIEGYRLSPQQRRVWGLQTEASFPAWCVVRIGATVDDDRVRRALAASVARHEILRTVFRCPPGATVPLQVIEEDGEHLALEVHDLRPLPPQERATRYAALRDRLRGAPLEPERGPRLAADLIRLDDETPDTRLLLRLPALCADEAALRVLADELADRLTGAGLPDPAEEPFQYADFSQWQEDLLTDGEFGPDRDYWRPRTAGGSAGAALPFAADAQGSFAPAALPAAIPQDLLPDLRDLAGRLGTDLRGVALAGWLVLLQRICGNDGPTVAVRCANRQAPELLDAVGLYEKYAPVPTRPGDDSFATFTGRLHDELRTMSEMQQYFDQAVWQAPHRRDEPGCPTAGFDWHRSAPADEGRPVEVEEAGAVTERFRVRLSGQEADRAVRLVLWYDTGSVEADDVAVLVRQYVALLHAAAKAPDTRALALPFDTGDEAPRPLPATPAWTVHRRFEEHARRRPDATAVRSEDRTLTAGELNEQANRLAHHLCALGAGADSVVGLCLERSADFVVALLAVLKSGAAYLPMDPATPPARRRRMLDDAGAALVVTTGGQAGPEAAGRTAVLLDSDAAAIARRRGDDPAGGPAGDRLAYVVYTSGSTGLPKGVAVSHANLAGYVEDVLGRLDLPAGADYALLSTPAADLGNTAVFAALCTGGTLHVLPPDTATDPVRLGSYLRRYPVDCMKIVPSHLRALLESADAADLLPSRRLVLGGEALDWDLVARVRELAPECRVLNHYGPTETTVGVLTQDVAAVERRTTHTVPLGRALPHTRVEVLDEAFGRAPVWVPGEICVGGTSVARGYLNRPGQTAERFLPDPHSDVPGARLYRTGDLARRLPDGTLVFLGRRDRQVKIRGHRVEPAEVAAVLRELPAVRQAVVLPREGSSGEPRLIAYVGADPATPVGDLRAHCARHLPDAMVPSAIVVLDGLPLTANGKLDERALPAPEDTGHAPYSPPRTPSEETLAEIWGKLLGVERVGRDDNFFALGGDSILGIQVVARAAQAGLALTPRLLFKYPTVARLAEAADASPGAAADRVRAEQGAVTGPVPLTPVQRRFLDQNRTAPGHYNQAVLLRTRRPLARQPLHTALRALVSHHDALRTRLVGTPEGTWALEIGDTAGAEAFPQLLTVADLSALRPDARRAALEKLAARTQASLDPEKGRLLRALYVTFDDDDHRLLLVVHHLGVDGVSWRILLEDLTTALRQAAEGRAVRLPAKTTSFRAWAEQLADRVGDHLPELPYWEGLLAQGAETGLPLAAGADPEADTHGTALSVDVALDEQTTQNLLRAHGTAPAQAILLTALGRTLTDWTGHRRTVVDIESHGREPLADDLDVTRTVGWFTTIYPIALDAGDVREALRSVKERLAAVPGHGRGYGMLRHMGDEAAAARLAALAPPQVRFNYHGQVVAGESESALFTSAPEDPGPPVDPGTRRPYPLDITAAVADGRLRSSWSYSPVLHDARTVEALASAFTENIRRVLDADGYAPADFPLARLDQGQLDAIAGMLEAADEG